MTVVERRLLYRKLGQLLGVVDIDGKLRLVGRHHQ